VTNTTASSWKGDMRAGAGREINLENGNRR